MTNTSTWHTSISDAIKVPIEKGRQSAFIFEDKDMQVRFYSPKQKDSQTPHHQDEVYVIDDLSTGKYENISHLVADKNFHCSGFDPYRYRGGLCQPAVGGSDGDL